MLKSDKDVVNLLHALMRLQDSWLGVLFDFLVQDHLVLGFHLRVQIVHLGQQLLLLEEL